MPAYLLVEQVLEIIFTFFTVKVDPEPEEDPLALEPLPVEEPLALEPLLGLDELPMLPLLPEADPLLSPLPIIRT
jgi:hypothetical protein